MTLYENSFPKSDEDRHAIWTLMVERDIEAFVSRDWSMVKADFLADGFFGIDAGQRDQLDSWRLSFPRLADYRAAWLEQASLTFAIADREEIRSGLIGAMTMRDIEVSGESALAHKKLDGEILLRDGTRKQLRWQSLFHCRKAAGQWKITSFIGYLPNPVGGAIGGADGDTRPDAPGRTP
ncbi:MAG: hypothetical protein WD273_15485 [Trueperaceae bacterium]